MDLQAPFNPFLLPPTRSPMATKAAILDSRSPSHNLDTRPKRVAFLDLKDTSSHPPIRLEHTCSLLRRTVSGLQSEDGGLFGNLYDGVYLRILGRLMWDREMAKKLRPVVSAKFAGYIAREELRFCITDHLDKPEAGDLKWGQTNIVPSKTDVLSFRHPAINGRLCAAYDETYRSAHPPPDVLEHRAKLGTMIIVTYLHELSYTWVHSTLRDFVSADWHTPAMDGYPEGEARFGIEAAMFGGNMVVVWRAVDLAFYEPCRWSLPMGGIWISPANDSSTSRLRPLSTEKLQAFHSSVATGSLTWHAVLDCFYDSTVDVEEKSAVGVACDGEFEILRILGSPRARCPEPIPISLSPAGIDLDEESDVYYIGISGCI
ncbi:hypothetical protein DFH09DRAFT_1126921 [Mycena vulgaris]|nr:hypothetical protein DFH09DRAFT_1126921 [Mycena vulgaris]